MQHPFCCYCGSPTEEPDHLPPQCFFYGGVPPEEGVFPSCKPCNSGYRRDDLAIKFLLSRSTFGISQQDKDRHQEALRGLRRHWPDLVKELKAEQSGGAAKKRHFRDLFGPTGDVLRLSGQSIATTGPITRAFLDRTALRFAKALFFRHNGRRLIGTVACTMLPTFRLSGEDLGLILEQLTKLQATCRGGKKLSDQYQYRFMQDAEKGWFAALVYLGGQFMINIIALEHAAADNILPAISEHAAQLKWQVVK